MIVREILLKFATLIMEATKNTKGVYNAAHPLVRIHSIRGRCGSYIGPESSVCERMDGPRCILFELSDLLREAWLLVSCQ